MTTTPAPSLATYADPADAYEAALTMGGVRAGVAVTAEGKYLTCTSKTARKYGWQFLGRIHGDLRERKSAK